MLLDYDSDMTNDYTKVEMPSVILAAPDNINLTQICEEKGLNLFILSLKMYLYYIIYYLFFKFLKLYK